MVLNSTQTSVSPDVNRAITGRIHSVETCGTVDGPGVRFVIFTQGCLLRCQYCHNPDSRDLHTGTEITVDSLITEIQKYRSYMNASGGGLTITGGEPLLQPEFVGEICRRCQELKIHTALDTSGYPKFEQGKEVLKYVDLVLLDIKSYDPQIYRDVTHVELEPTLKFARYLNDIKKPTWVRFVLVPNLTDAPHNIAGLAQFVASLDCVEKVELLPFHQMGKYKWEQMGLDYPLKDTEPPTAEKVAEVRRVFEQYHLRVE
ncbi:MAG: pyruvate formate-lyase-activating protein [Jaaginema sp. PMC 1079.18]|nr:pyruvate formate-lyase-activating protein [Jaaginema sp. PMC 1080.18]MEC4851975.1 pyruvate formate-lyase-activating protein [Jaaginema sp. PMC 1079.18]MEC4868381.1 pyruvate formate-lyase-activating protein [Jaaginema sp. PMC 1078.18]